MSIRTPSKQKTDLSSLIRPQKLQLATLPTPITPLVQIGRELPCPVSMKRDDNTGCLLSGNKIRKLEYVLADAKNKGATIVLTCGGTQSNHARATAVAARQIGLDSLLVLRNSDGDALQIDGNLLIDTLVGSQIKLITPEEYETWPQILQEEAKNLKKGGQVPYIIPEGASNPLGCWGYLDMMHELLQGTKHLPYTHLAMAVGSCGTLAGVLIGRSILKLDIKIVGFSVCGSEEETRKSCQALIEGFNKRFGLNIDPGDYELHDGYNGPGYAIPFKEELDAIRRLARLEGILLDPTYTGKAWYGLLDLMKKAKFKNSDHVLFLHTGGIFGLLHGDLGAV